MDPEHVSALPHSETIPQPAHSLGPDEAETIPGPVPVDPFNPYHSNAQRMSARIDTGHLSPSARNLISSTSSGKSEVSETSLLHHSRIINDHPQPIQPPVPVRLPDSSSRRETRINSHNQSQAVDWIVPTEKVAKNTVGERLQPTLDIAIIERDKCAAKAKWTGITLNAAIGLQVLLGSLTTGLSALSITGGSTAKATTALGALATLVASYLARARGSNEPELSIARNKDLDQFIRECRAFQLDHGHVTGDEFDNDIIHFRRRFEELLGNANKERKSSPPA